MGNANPKSQNPQVKSTLAFRVINPELFIKPNKVVMGFGILCFGGCILYLFNMNLNNERRHTTVSVGGKRSVDKSKWN